MEVVTFLGKDYTKASVLAEKFRYTQDYLGQLCRAKKVDARLVGRAWYINLDSLMAHKDTRYQSVAKSAEKTSKKPSNHYLSRIDVEPILKKKTVKILKNNTKGALTEFPVKYEADDYSLIPRVHKGAIFASIPVDPAEAEKLSVRPKQKVETRFTPEPLPEVSLRGRLSIAALPEVTEAIPEVFDTPPVAAVIEPKAVSALAAHAATTRQTVASTAQSSPQNQGATGELTSKIKPRIVSIRRPSRLAASSMRPVGIRPTVSVTPSAQTQHASQSRPVLTTAPAPVRIREQVAGSVSPVQKSTQTSPKAFVMKVQEVPETPVVAQNPASGEQNASTQPRMPQFRPQTVLAKEQTALPTPTSWQLIVTPVVVVVIALVCGSLIVATNSEVVAHGSHYESRFVLETDNFANLATLIFHK